MHRDGLRVEQQSLRNRSTSFQHEKHNKALFTTMRVEKRSHSAAQRKERGVARGYLLRYFFFDFDLILIFPRRNHSR